MPDVMQFYQGHQTLYTYSANGTKLHVTDKTAPDGVNLPVSSLNTILTSPSIVSTSTTDYIGNMIYENGTLKRILTATGYIEGGIYYTYLKDHLGNNRMALEPSGNAIEIMHYYPSGVAFGESTLSCQPYRFGGKGYDEMHGLHWYDFHARSYDRAMGRFTTVDPLCEKYYAISPYAYCADNPVNRIDPTGMEWKTKEDEEYAKSLSQAMTNKMNSEQKNLDKLNVKIAQNQEKGKDISKDQMKAAGMQANIDNLKTGVSELTAMGDTKDQVFTYNKIDGNTGKTTIQNGIVVMNIADNGNTTNGVHESSHGYDVWKNGMPKNIENIYNAEIKVYGRQFSFGGQSAMPQSDGGRHFFKP